MQEALKSGVGVDSADNFWGGTNCVDDFFVDQLLDFSHGFTEAGQSEEPEEMEHDKKNARYVSQEKLESSAVSLEDDFGPLPSFSVSLNLSVFTVKIIPLLVRF